MRRRAILEAAGLIVVMSAVPASAAPAIGSTGTPVPPEAIYLGATTPNRTLTGLSVDASGNLKVNVATITGTVTANQGTALPQSGAGWPVQPWGMADTLMAGGSVTAPAAGAAIATLAAPPAGTYRIHLLFGVFTDSANMEFREGATVKIGSQGSAAAPYSLELSRVTLDGLTALSINATAAGSVGALYIATILATRIF